MENEKTEKTEISENDEKSVNDKNEEKAESKVSKIWFYSKKLIRSVCFFLILGILLSVIGYALMPKNNSQKSGMRNEHSVGFYSESAGSIDVFFLGNSNTYAAFSPIELWREYGIQTYTSGVGYERVVEAYTMVKDLLRFHKPKVIALETDCIFSEKKGSDDIGEAIEKLVYSEMPVLKYHNRWKTVYPEEMFSSPEYTWHSYSHGQYVSAAVQPYKGIRLITPTSFVEGIDPITLFYLHSIVSLCKENDIELMFVCAPCIKSWKYQRHNAVQKLADDYGLDFIDFNLLEDEIKFNWQKDTRDKGTHLNVYGAKKVSKYIGKYLVEKYSLKDYRSDKDIAKQWQKDYKSYLKQINKTKQQKVASEN